MTAEVKQEAVKSEVQQTSLTDGKDELFYRPQNFDSKKDSVPTESTQDNQASQNSVDFGSAGGLDKCDLADSRGNTAQTNCSNGQKSKRTTSPGPPPVKMTCDDAHSHNPKLTLCLSVSPRKGLSTPSDVEMLSPDSPVCKTMLIKISSDKYQDESACAEDSGFGKDQVVESQQFFNDPDSGKSVKERPPLVAMETEDAEVAECSGSSIFKRYL